LLFLPFPGPKCKAYFVPSSQKLLLRAYPNNPLYYGRLQSPMPALSAKNVLNVEKTTPGEHFWPAASAS
jgi:hypothetical protein